MAQSLVTLTDPDILEYDDFFLEPVRSNNRERKNIKYFVLFLLRILSHIAAKTVQTGRKQVWNIKPKWWDKIFMAAMEMASSEMKQTKSYEHCCKNTWKNPTKKVEDSLEVMNIKVSVLMDHLMKKQKVPLELQNLYGVLNDQHTHKKQKEKLCSLLFNNIRSRAFVKNAIEAEIMQTDDSGIVLNSLQVCWKQQNERHLTLSQAKHRPEDFDVMIGRTEDRCEDVQHMLPAEGQTGITQAENMVTSSSTGSNNSNIDHLQSPLNNPTSIHSSVTQTLVTAESGQDPDFHSSDFACGSSHSDFSKSRYVHAKLLERLDSEECINSVYPLKHAGADTVHSVNACMQKGVNVRGNKRMVQTDSSGSISNAVYLEDGIKQLSKVSRSECPYPSDQVQSETFSLKARSNRVDGIKLSSEVKTTDAGGSVLEANEGDVTVPPYCMSEPPACTSQPDDFVPGEIIDCLNIRSRESSPEDGSSCMINPRKRLHEGETYPLLKKQRTENPETCASDSFDSARLSVMDPMSLAMQLSQIVNHDPPAMPTSKTMNHFNILGCTIHDTSSADVYMHGQMDTAEAGLDIDKFLDSVPDSEASSFATDDSTQRIESHDHFHVHFVSIEDEPVQLRSEIMDPVPTVSGYKKRPAGSSDYMVQQHSTQTTTGQFDMTHTHGENHVSFQGALLGSDDREWSTPESVDKVNQYIDAMYGTKEAE